MRAFSAKDVRACALLPAALVHRDVHATEAETGDYHSTQARIRFEHMDGLFINISWEYFLGIIGTLIGLAYYASSRFTALEIDIGWLKEMISELSIKAENVNAKLFKNGSPVSLTSTGYHILARCGLRSFVDANRRTLLAALNAETFSDFYEIQRRAFSLLAELTLDDAVARHLNNFAFSNGMSTVILRRAAAIYLRDLAVAAN
ncbi:MAG: hypothetical protein ABR881_32380 [Candidatus Sulfotelmatobacter sp.]